MLQRSCAAGCDDRDADALCDRSCRLGVGSRGWCVAVDAGGEGVAGGGGLGGGGGRNGARAQEEDLCRKSSLLLSLESKEAREYYDYNKSLNTYMGSDALMIAPYVEIIKDENGDLLDDTVVVSVLTCAAPMISHGKEGMSESEYEDMVYNRIMGMLKCSAYLGYRHLVLGAWGCGAFGNDAHVISDLFY